MSLETAPQSLLLQGIGTLVTGIDGQGEGPLGLVRDAAVLCRGGRIVYAGPESELPPAEGPEPITLDLDGHLVTSGLVDCHTHMLYAGSRLGDFEARLGGDTYAAIAGRGGGILSTVQATRAASDAYLLDLLQARVEQAASQGVTTIEVKSGYGLDTRQELRMLQVVRSCNLRSIPELIPTFLGAHTLPAEARTGDRARAAYVDAVIDEMLPQVAERGLARFCDVYVDQAAFTVDEGRRILEAARALGLRPKVHAEQITHTGAAGLAAEVQAVSAEHLEHATDDDLAAMASAGVVAVLLPAAAFFLQDEFPAAGRFRQAGLEMAVATDHNPGSSPTNNLLLVAQMAVLGCGMTWTEALLGVTHVAAKALGLEEDRGQIAEGKRADLALFRCKDPRELLYHVGATLCSGVVKDGRYIRVEAARPASLRSAI